MALMEGYDRGADTCAVVDRDGNIAEGPGFNIFAVKDGRVITPPEDVCLDGMTRDTVFKLAAETNLEMRKRPLPPDEMRDGRRGLHLDHRRRHHCRSPRSTAAPIASGQPGPVTQRLDGLYWRSAAPAGMRRRSTTRRRCASSRSRESPQRARGVPASGTCSIENSSGGVTTRPSAMRIDTAMTSSASMTRNCSAFRRWPISTP